MYTTNIDYVVKTSWGYHDGTKRGGFTYHVHYKPSEKQYHGLKHETYRLKEQA